MKKYILVNFLLLIFLFNPLFSQNEEKITWYSFEDAAKLENPDHKKIFIDIYTAWCGWCKVLDKSTFPDTTIIRLMNKYFIAVKLDAERKDTILFNNYLFVNPNPEGYRSAHQLASSLLKGRLSYPSMCFLTDSFALITTVQSYLKPTELEPILEYIGSDKYLTMTYDSFSLAYTPISGAVAASTTESSLGSATYYIPDKLEYKPGVSEINSEAFLQLDGVVDVLKSNPSIKAEIGGYTDSSAIETSDTKLSGIRAKTVYDYFVSKGIDSSRMTYVGYGSLRPMGDNDTEEGRKKNRRIEIKLITQ